MRTLISGCLLTFSTFMVVLLLSFNASARSLEQQRDDFLAAERALKRGQMERFDQLMSYLKGYALYPYLLDQRLRKQSNSEYAVRAFLDQFGDSYYAKRYRAKLLAQLAARGAWQEYLRYYLKTDSAEQQCNYFRALAQTGRSDEAFDGARQQWLSGKAKPKACQMLFQAWQGTGALSQELVWQRFSAALRGGKPEVAKAVKQRYLATAQYPTADFWLRVHRQPRKVLDGSLWHQGGPLQGRIFAHGVDRLGRKDRMLALEVWQQRKGHFSIPPADAAFTARRLGTSLARSRMSQALALLNSFPPQYDDEASLGWRIRAALLANDWRTVDAALKRLPSEARKSPQWLYWQGKTADALGRKREALKHFSAVAADRSFYGFLAADQLGLNYNRALADHSAAVSPALQQRVEQSRPFRAAAEFRHFGRDLSARREWWHALKGLDSLSIRAAAKLAQRWQWHQVAIFTLAKSDYWDDLTLRFPLLYKPSLLQQAASRGIDPAIPYAILRRESAYQSTARSPVGALGLMQIMPKTGQYIAGQLNERLGSSKRLYDPDLNIRYGTFYISEMLRRFDGQLALAAAAYNAGPHRVKQWLPSGRPMPADIWVELIRFNETRKYVTTVMAYRIVYQSRLGEPVGRISDMLPTITRLKPGKGHRRVTMSKIDQ